MVATIPDLWPKLKLDILSPATILKSQVDYIRKSGQGVLDAELTIVTGKDDFVIYRLDLIAPISNGQRYRVLIATHRAEYYPIQIEADCFRPKTKKMTTRPSTVLLSAMNVLNEEVNWVESLTWPPEGDWRKIAWDQAELFKIIGQVLQSAEVRSAIESFIARTNELQQSANEGSEVDPQSVA